MNKCIFSPRSQRDFAEILDFLGKNDPDSALDFITRLQLMCERLAKMPELGRKRDDIKSGYRSFPIERYIIFYRMTDEGVEILGIVHGARDIENIFSE
jgi:toxin ParE1/3/4